MLTKLPRCDPLTSRTQAMVRYRSRTGKGLCFISLIFGILMQGVLSGCFGPYAPSRPYTLCQTDLDKNVETAFSSPAVASGDIIYEQWWNFFKDPQLDRLIKTSLTCHPNLLVAEARIRAACDVAKIARSTIFPHLFGVIDVKRQKVQRISTRFCSRLSPNFLPMFPLSSLHLSMN